MTEDERRLIRTCIGNGFEFHRRMSEMNGRVTVKVGDTFFDFDRLCELADEVEKALDMYERSEEK